MLTVPNFVPTLGKKLSHLVTQPGLPKSLLLAQETNVIANYHSRYENRAPQLLTEGLLV